MAAAVTRSNLPPSVLIAGYLWQFVLLLYFGYFCNFWFGKGLFLFVVLGMLNFTVLCILDFILAAPRTRKY